ncbi:MAG: hypothetical protein HUU10_14545 [Bacteroidetes bacterium]|nr:hypothetical protein [Bacteroidota bacterium]
MEKKKLYFLYDTIISYEEGHKSGGARGIKILQDKVTFIAFDDYDNALQFKEKIKFDGIIIEAEKYGTLEYPVLYVKDKTYILLFNKESLELYEKKEFDKLKDYVFEYKSTNP